MEGRIFRGDIEAESLRHIIDLADITEVIDTGRIEEGRATKRGRRAADDGSLNTFLVAALLGSEQCLLYLPTPNKLLEFGFAPASVVPLNSRS